MDAIVLAADRVGAWIVADEIYRGAELDSDVTSPTFWGRYDKVIITSGLSKAFAMPGLRVGWVVGPSDFIRGSGGATTTPRCRPACSRTASPRCAMLPEVREAILARTRAHHPRELPAHGGVAALPRATSSGGRAPRPGPSSTRSTTCP